MSADQSSGSIRSASVTEPTTSAKTAVTGLRSPATARLGAGAGVGVGAGACGSGGAAATGVPHVGQNRAPAGRSALQLEHRSAMARIVRADQRRFAARIADRSRMSRRASTRGAFRRLGPRDRREGLPHDHGLAPASTWCISAFRQPAAPHSVRDRCTSLEHEARWRRRGGGCAHRIGRSTMPTAPHGTQAAGSAGHRPASSGLALPRCAGVRKPGAGDRAGPQGRRAAAAASACGCR